MKIFVALFGFFLIQLCSAVYPYCNNIHDPKIPCSERYPDGTYMNGNRPNPNETCSNTFFVCSNGISYCYNCQIFGDGSMLYYDHSKLRCDYRREIPACTVAPPTPTTIPLTSSTRISTVVSTTTAAPTTTSTTVPTSTTTKALSTSNSPTTVPTSTSTKAVSTSNSPTTISTTPSTSCYSAIQPSSGVLKFKCPEPNGFFPIDEGICVREHYICVDESIYYQTCPSGTLFDPAFTHCINVTLVSCNFQCSAKDGFYPVPGKNQDFCFSGFIHCIMQKANPGRCPGTSTFHPQLLSCVQREDFCDGGSTKQVSTATIPSTTSPATFVCPPGQGQYPVVGSCTLYYVCSGGTLTTIAQCPPCEIFNPPTQYCEIDAVVPGCPKVVSFLDYYQDSKFVGTSQ